MLAALGAGFDCASVMELEAVEGWAYAVAHGVQKTTFDNSYELHKIVQLNPHFQCVLRIRCDDPTAKWALGAKYGADMPEVPGLLQLARELGLQVIGVSFHVGSGCQDTVFDMAEQQYGFPPLTLLDIGGGFTAPCDEPSSALFRQTARTINARWTRASRQAAAWRFFAETSAALFATVVGHRVVDDATSGQVIEYVLSDSSLGSFRSLVLLERLEPNYVLLRSPLLPSITDKQQQQQQQDAAQAASCCGIPLLSSVLMGGSNVDADVIHARAQLPRLRDGDWLMFPYFGSYTISCAT
ncbi:hypothetical protein COO60DRAFT_1639561 [Scenedesmus sp. NREL 46B-D3]|nr:hypothetical protein COO60DRAFT_1639561 [Scenedesmus sp. NREL 46B-D3]